MFHIPQHLTTFHSLEPTTVTRIKTLNTLLRINGRSQMTLSISKCFFMLTENMNNST